LAALLSDLLGLLSGPVRRFCGAATGVIHDLAGGVGNGSGSFLGFCAHRVSCFFRPLGSLISGPLGFFTDLVRRFCGTVHDVFRRRPRLIHGLADGSAVQEEIHVKSLLWLRLQFQIAS